jgi:malonyl-CoA/methylmalonyl-CoA synthetase
MASTSTLVGRWLARADDRRATPAVFEPDSATSWPDVVAGAERVAGALLAGRRSLEGERVALLVPGGASFLASFFGVVRAGGVAVVLSPLHPPPETKYLCDDAGVRTVIASSSLADTVRFLAPERTLVGAEDLMASGSGGFAGIAAETDDDMAALQLYTSGTTGKPKGAVLTHRNLAVQQELLGRAWGWRAEDVLLHVLPLHHMHGLAIALLSAVGAGASTRFLRAAGAATTGSFDARATWSAMHEGTVFMAVPTIHARLFAALDAADAETRDRWRSHARGLRLVTSGSAALPVTIGERWRELTGEYPLERFGMTEIGVGASNPLEPEARRPGTVGTPLPTVGTRIVDDELWIAGPSVFAGYHGRPQATREAFVVDAGERWFKTGDTVSFDADGYLRILGRTSVDILKSGGYKISALEIEEALREHPAVAEAAVVGVPDPAWGDRIVACVVARDGCDAQCTEDGIRAFAKERIAPYKVPKQVVRMRDLPRNALGKVLKAELVKRVASEPPHRLP